VSDHHHLFNLLKANTEQVYK